MNDADAPRTLLITLTGKDRPGVTSALFATLAASRVEVLDIEQIVLRGRLVLGLLVTAPRGLARRCASAVEAGGGRPRHGRSRSTRAPATTAAGRDGRAHVTVLGQPAAARRAVAAIAGRIADTGANIDRIVRMARYPVTAIEFHVSGADARPAARRCSPGGGARRASTSPCSAAACSGTARGWSSWTSTPRCIQGEVIELLAAHAGCEAEVARGHRGGDARRARLRERAAGAGRAAGGADADGPRRGPRRARLAPGARTLVRTLKRLGYRFAIVCGGFTQVTDRLAADLGIDFAGRQRRSRSSTASSPAGSSATSSTGPARPRRCAGSPPRPASRSAATVAIGDGANDLDMLAAAGLGIAFNAKPVVREAATPR